jgi:hypothetical protein
MPSKALACTVATCLLLTSTGLVIAQSNTGCDATNCTGPRGEWHANRENVVQSAEVTASNNAVGVGIQIQTQDRVPQSSAGGPGGIIQEQPKGPQHFSGPGISAPGSSNPGTSPDPILPLDGSNIIVPGGPTSSETSLGQPPTTFGGFSIGGWTFDTSGNPGVTTGFAPTGPVPHIDPHALAISAEQEFPLPAITLQANPDPGRVNIDTWFWVSGYNGSILTHSKTQHASHRECRLLEGVPDCRTVDDSVTVVVHLTPKHYGWTFGDDRNNSALFADNRGLGRAYTDPDPRDASPVAHAYHWSSINYVNQGGYPITLTIDWLAEFSANGGGFQGIPDVVHTYDGHHQVRQIQSIVTQ